MREPSVTIKMSVEPSRNTVVSDTNIAAGVIISNVGPITPRLFNSRSEVLRAFTTTGTITRSTDTTLIHAAAIAEFMPIYLCRAFKDDGVRAGKAISVNLTDLGKVIKKNGVIYPVTTKLEILKDRVDYTVTKPFYVTLGGITYFYYTGITKDSELNLVGLNSATKVPLYEGLSDEGKLIDQLINLINLNSKNTAYYIELTGETEQKYQLNVYSAQSIDESSYGYVVGGSDPIAYQYIDTSVSLGTEEIAFYVFSNNPGDQDFTITVQTLRNTDRNSPKAATHSDFIGIEVVTPTRNYNYEGSLNPDYVNNYGYNQYIGNVNEYSNIEFSIESNSAHHEVLNIPDGVTKSFQFGSRKVLNTKSIDLMKESLEKISDQEEYSLAFLCPLNYNNPSYINQLSIIGDKIFAFVPVGINTKFNDADVITRSAAGISKASNILLLTPNDRNTTIANFAIDMSLEVAYLRKIQYNKLRGLEFAPVMGETNGSISLENPSVTLTKSVREKLLDSRINSLITKRTGELTTYFNKNKTNTTSDDVMSEEQNQRLAYKINRDIDNMMTKYIGEFNNAAIRNKVVNEITQYFNNNIMNLSYTLYEAPKITCDDSNNDANIIAANKLVVDIKVVYNNTIYEVEVYHRAFDIANNK